MHWSHWHQLRPPCCPPEENWSAPDRADASLPVVDGEIGDVWIPGVSSDVWKASVARRMQRAWDEIARDMAGSYPMRRLLQGDVGSGKTAVAACAGLRAVESGFSVVVLAPTEILAEQHYRVFGKRLEPLGIPEHLHVHCVARWSGDTNFMTAAAGIRVLPEALVESWSKLRENWPA